MISRMTGGFRPYLLLSLLCLAIYLPGLSAVPPLDRDESRFIQATRQMLVSGDYIRIQFQTQMRAKKPVGAYWLQAAAVRAFSHPLSAALWPYRLPGALAAWAVTLMTFAFGRSLLGSRSALLAGIMVASALILVSEAHQAKTDAVLLACAVAAQGTLARFYVAGRARSLADGVPVKGEPGWVEALVFWLAQGIAILVKGPMVPVVSLLTIAALAVSDRSARWVLAIRPLPGVIVAALVAAPWFVAISRATGGAFVGDAVRQDLLPKLLGAQESHGAPPGYYLALAIITLWPASLLIWPAMVRAWSERRRLVYRFLLAWALPCWAMFELVPTKLPHYVLPAVPALALIAAGLVAENAEVFHHRLTRAYYLLWIVIGLVLAAAVVALPIRFGAGFEPSMLPAAAGIVLATLLPATLAFRGRLVSATLALALTAAATYPVVFSQVLPRLDRLWISRSVAEVVGGLGASQPVVAAGYDEPSLVVLLGTDTVLTGGDGAADWLSHHPRSLAVVADNEEAAFAAGTAVRGAQVEPLAHVEGFNYSRGKAVAITVYGMPRR